MQRIAPIRGYVRYVSGHNVIFGLWNFADCERVWSLQIIIIMGIWDYIRSKVIFVVLQGNIVWRWVLLLRNFVNKDVCVLTIWQLSLCHKHIIPKNVSEKVNRYIKNTETIAITIFYDCLWILRKNYFYNVY